MKKFSPARFMNLFGAIVLIAGLVGFLASKSIISLVSSAVFAVLALISGYGLGKNLSWAYPLGLATNAILGLFFMWRVTQGSSFPALAIVGLSLIGLALLLETKKS